MVVIACDIAVFDIVHFNIAVRFALTRVIDIFTFTMSTCSATLTHRSIFMQALDHLQPLSQLLFAAAKLVL